MNTQELQNDKLSIINWITQLQDKGLIQEIKKMMSVEISKDDNWYDLLSEKDKKNIEISLQQADNCNTIPHKVVSKKIKDKISKLKNS